MLSFGLQTSHTPDLTNMLLTAHECFVSLRKLTENTVVRQKNVPIFNQSKTAEFYWRSEFSLVKN